MYIMLCLQVLPLDELCIAQYLQTFSSSFTKADFAVICKNMTLHFAKLNPDLSVSLEKLSEECREDGPGVFVEDDSEVQAVSLIDETTVDMCGLNSGGTEMPDLPPNVNCVEDARLYPLHDQKAFLLHCETEGGPTLYLVPVIANMLNENVRAIQADGRPYSSHDGAYIIVVDGQRVTLYITEDSSVPGKAKTYSSNISTLEFLSSKYALVLTKGNEHSLFGLKNSSRAQLNFSGGQAVAWAWVNSSDVYVYATKGDDGLFAIHIFNTTLDKELFELKDIVEQPEMMLFVEKSADSSPPRSSYQGEGDTPVVVVAATSVSAGIVVIIVLVLVVLSVAFACSTNFRNTVRRHYKHISKECSSIGTDSNAEPSEDEPQKTPTPPPPTDPAVPLPGPAVPPPGPAVPPPSPAVPTPSPPPSPSVPPPGPSMPPSGPAVPPPGPAVPTPSPPPSPSVPPPGPSMPPSGPAVPPPSPAVPTPSPPPSPSVPPPGPSMPPSGPAVPPPGPAVPPPISAVPTPGPAVPPPSPSSSEGVKDKQPQQETTETNSQVTVHIPEHPNPRELYDNCTSDGNVTKTDQPTPAHVDSSPTLVPVPGERPKHPEESDRETPPLRTIDPLMPFPNNPPSRCQDSSADINFPYALQEQPPHEHLCDELAGRRK